MVNMIMKRKGRLTQLEECLVCNQDAGGSNPSSSTPCCSAVFDEIQQQIAIRDEYERKRDAYE